MRGGGVLRLRSRKIVTRPQGSDFVVQRKVGAKVFLARFCWAKFAFHAHIRLALVFYARDF